VSLNAGESYSFTVDYSPTAEGTHTGLITITNNLGGDAPTIDLSGSAYDPVVSSFPWNENFDAIAVGAMPANWTLFESHTGTDARGWIAGENIVANSLPNAAVVYYHSSYAKDEWMITPPLALEGGQLYTLSFAMKAPGWEGAPEALKVHFGTEATIAGMTANTPLWDNNNITQAEFTTLLLPFTPATTGTYYFGWHAYSNADNDFVAVDDISLFIPAAIDAAVTGFNGTIAVVAGNAATYNVQVTNMGATDIPAYTVLLKDSTTQATLAQASISETLLIGLSATHELSWTPTVDGDYSVYAQVVAPGDLVTSNDSSDAMDVLVYPETMNMLYVGDPNSTTGSTAYPINMYYEDFIAETVYLASEIQATSGSLEALVYTNSFATAGTEQVQIWIQNTTAEDLSAGWLPWAEYTQVFDGELEFPAGMNYIQIPITPFNYTGGNLAIRTSVTYVDGWTSNNLWQITADPAGRVRTRYQQADGSELDHTAPTGTSTVTSFPNVYFFLDTEYMVASTAAPVAEVSQDAGVVELEWPVVPYAYSYNIYNSIDPYSFGTEPLATVYNNNYSYTPGAEVDANFYKVTSATYRDLARASYSPARAKKAAQPELQNVEKDQKIKTRERKSAVK
ncbi:MAG: choice-of-anchor J domain-containing protein, partial [Candidatus Cloacimonetes bacterium]|nr:choice-of-anchor J domain-containing protein [Candidatus Cloacimonadota bacterium]